MEVLRHYRQRRLSIERLLFACIAALFLLKTMGLAQDCIAQPLEDDAGEARKQTTSSMGSAGRPQIQDRQSAGSPLQGRIGVESDGVRPVLLPGVPKLDEIEPHSGSVRKDGGKSQLKRGKPETDEEKRKRLIAEAYMKYGTSGIVLARYAKSWVVHAVLRGGPAERIGILPGDELLSVNGRLVRGLPIRNLHFMLTGFRGQNKSVAIKRSGKKLTMYLPLWGVYDFKDRRSQYIVYYYYLLYNNLITPEQHKKAIAPFLYYTPVNVSTFKRRQKNRRPLSR